MAEKLCQLKKKGGGGELKETVLWTNSSPSVDFLTQIIDLSDDINNYDYIACEFAYSKAYLDITAKNMCTTEDFKKDQYGLSSRKVGLGIVSVLPSGDAYGRLIQYYTDTKARISDGLQLGVTQTNQSLLIPLKMIGIKK